MTDVEFDKVFQDYLGGWKYKAGEIATLRARIMNISAGAFQSACQQVLANREDNFKPPVGALIRLANRGAANDGAWWHDAEYAKLRGRILNGSITHLYWSVKQQDFPAVVNGEYVYLHDDTGATPCDRVVTLRTWGREVVESAGGARKHKEPPPVYGEDVSDVGLVDDLRAGVTATAATKLDEADDLDDTIPF